jgi:hypothetical protein
VRQRRWIGLACLAAWAAGPAAGQGRPLGWAVYADGAAAYQTNAALADPDRPAAMAAQISDVATDNAKAAAGRWRAQTGGSAAAAQRAVASRVKRRAKVLVTRPRATVEHLIDACPQLDG